MASGRAPLLAALLIVAAAALAYHNTFSVPFVFDDKASILGNPTLGNLLTAWSPPREGGLTVSGRPLLNFTLALNHAVSGTAVWSYHLLNLLIHAVAGCTLFGIVRRTLLLGPVGRDRLIPPDCGGGPTSQLAAAQQELGPPKAGSAIPPYRKDATWLALVVALLWTLHPLQTQSVTYIIQRAESLVGLMQLLTLWCFVRSVEPGAARSWAWLAGVTCLLGMASKEVMVTAPVLVALYDRIFVAGGWREVWARRGRFHLALVSTWLLLGWLVLDTGARDGTAGFGGGVSPWAYALTQVGAVGHYLRLVFWPQPLVFDYGKELARGWGDVWLPALVVLPLLAASVWAAWRGRAAGFLGVCFFAVLAPSSSFVPVLTQTVSEHRVYLSLAAVVTLVVCGLHPWWGRRGLLVCGVLAVGLGVATARRNLDYRSEQALWEDTVAKRPDNPRALVTLGTILERENQADLALPLFERAVALAPDYVEAQNNLGDVWIKLGHPDRALACYQRALALDPAQPAVLHNVGAALVTAGRIPEAVTALEQALRLKPDQAQTRFTLAGALARQGRHADAAAHFVRYLQEKPDDAEAHGIYGGILIALARPREALAEFETAVRLQPGNAELHNLLGGMLAESGRLAEALPHFQEAVRLQPDYAGARANLERATRALGRR